MAELEIQKHRSQKPPKSSRNKHKMDVYSKGRKGNKVKQQNKRNIFNTKLDSQLKDKGAVQVEKRPKQINKRLKMTETSKWRRRLARTRERNLITSIQREKSLSKSILVPPPKTLHITYICSIIKLHLTCTNRNIVFLLVCAFAGIQV